MRDSLGPVGYGAEAAVKRLTLGMYGTGLFFGSILAASLLSIVGLFITAVAPRWGADTVLAVAGILVVLQIAGVRPPQSSWQVPEHWRRSGMSIDFLALGYGLLLGVGFLTSVVVAAFWAFVAMSVTIEPWIVLIAWVTFVLVRFSGLWWAMRQHMVESWSFGPSRLVLVIPTAVLALLTIGVHRLVNVATT